MGSGLEPFKCMVCRFIEEVISGCKFLKDDEQSNDHASSCNLSICLATKPKRRGMRFKEVYTNEFSWQFKVGLWIHNTIALGIWQVIEHNHVASWCIPHDKTILNRAAYGLQILRVPFSNGRYWVSIFWDKWWDFNTRHIYKVSYDKYFENPCAIRCSPSTVGNHFGPQYCTWIDLKIINIILLLYFKRNGFFYFMSLVWFWAKKYKFSVPPYKPLVMYSRGRWLQLLVLLRN